MVDENHSVGAREDEPVSPWEWAVAAISAVMVGGTLLIVLFSAITVGNDPPQIEFEVVRVVEQPDMWVVEFWIHNHGGTTAQSFVVEGVLVDEEGSVVETRQASLRAYPDTGMALRGPR